MEKTFTEINLGVADSLKCIGIGSAKIKSGKWIRSRISIHYLEKAIRILNALELDTVDLIFTKDNVVILGTIKDGVAQGVFIAPRIENE